MALFNDLIANHDGDVILALIDACNRIDELQQEIQLLEDEIEWIRDEGII